MGPPLPVHQSGNSAQKVMDTTGEVKSGKLWYKAMFSLIAREVSLVTITSSKKEGTDNFIFHQSTPHIDIFFDIMRIFTSLYMITVPVDCYTHTQTHSLSLSLTHSHEMLLHQKNTFC
jgi:hypothetical protein